MANGTLKMDDIEYFSNSLTTGPNVTGLSADCFRNGRMIYMTVSWKGPVTGTEPIFTVPANYRPKQYWHGTGVFVKNGVEAWGNYTINPNTGDVYQNLTSGAVTAGSFTMIYPLGE